MGNTNLFEEVKNLADIVHLIGSLSSGKITGSGNKRQLSECPFCQGHGCFSITVDKQLFNCFQCPGPKTGGDVFTFMMKLNHYDRYSALKAVAQHVGYTLPEKNKPARRDIRHEISLKLKQDWASPEAKQYWAYLIDTRKLSPEILKAHDAGFYRGRQDMITYLNKKGFKIDEIKASGILTRHFGEFYRIIFFWRGGNGRTEGFVGAATSDQLESVSEEDKDQFPKYKKNVNFHTSAPFNLYYAKRWVPEDHSLVFVEGILDCLHLLSIGIKNVIALGGSAFEAEFIQALQKTTYSRLILLFDADTAGIKATRRTTQMIWESGAKYHLYVAQIVMTDPADESRMIKDPDEVIRKLGAEMMKSIIKDPVKVGPWLVGSLWDQTDMKSPIQRDQVLEEVAGFWSYIDDEIERKEMLVVLNEACGVPQENLRKTIEKHVKPALLHSSTVAGQKKDHLSAGDKDVLVQLKQELREAKEEIKTLKKKKKLLLTAYASFVVHVKTLSAARLNWHLGRIAEVHRHLLTRMKKDLDGVQGKIQEIEAIFLKSKIKNVEQIQEKIAQFIKDDLKD